MGQLPTGFTLHLDEKLCTTLIQSIRGIVWEADASDFRFLYVSPQAEQILGYPLAQWLDEPDFWHSHLHPEDVGRCLEYCRKAITGHEAHAFECRMIGADGTVVSLHDIVTVVEDGGGGLRLQGIMIDITPLQQAEEKLQLTKAFLDQAPIGFLQISPDGKILEANEFSCSSLGYSRQELRTMSVFDFDAEFTEDMWPAHFERLRAAGAMSFETTHIARDGSRFPMEISAAVLELDGKEFLYSFEKDIRERRKTELALQEQEELYRAMVDQAPDGVVLVDTETLGLKEFNDTACEALGYSREEFARLTALDINAEFPENQYNQLTKKFIDQGHLVFETLHRHKNGSLRNTRVSLRVVHILEHRYFLAFWTDITERVRLNRELSLREHYQRALLDNFPYAVWMKDEAGRYLAANRKQAEYLGLERWEELVGRTNDDFLPPDLCRRIAEEDRKILLSGEPKHAEELLPVQGKQHWFAVYQSPVTIDGKRIGTVGCNWDITEQKMVSQALAESEARYRKLVELSPDSVYIHRDSRFVFMNTPGAELLGARRPEDLYGRNVLDFVHPDYRSKVAQRINYAEGRRKNPPVEMILLRSDGSQVPVEMVSVYFSYQNRDSVLAVARDISERKRMQEELVKAQRLESLGVLAGGIAHDFNNILTGILGNISLMRHTLDPAAPMADRLKSCEQAAIRASELTQQLLTFARGGAPVKKLMDPSTMIRESAAFLLHGSQIGCIIKLSEDLWHIRADAGQISQVLHNILFNAMQAMPDGGKVFISASNRQLQRPNAFNLPVGEYLQIDIEDQGCGIPPENLPKIFDPYFSTKSEGNGLGLASVYSVIKRHGGAVDVNSTVGVGTRFSLFLPATSGERTLEVENEMVRKMIGSGTILVMDDEQIIREVAGEILTAAGFQVESCADGRQAVQRYRRKLDGDIAYDAVIMDLTIPGGMGGREAAVQILEIDPEAVLIVSSGYSNDPVVADFRRFGFRGAVIKPFAAETLVAEVQRLVGGGRRDATSGT